MQRKKIVFFSREELTYLYGSLHESMCTDFDILHVAYSQKEAAILKSEFGIENIFVFKEEYRKAFAGNKGYNDTLLNKIDQLFITHTGNRFSLNASMQSDRTFKQMSYEKALEITCVYYSVWERLFSEHRVDFFLHEPCSLMMNHMAFVLCKNQGGVYNTQITVHGHDQYNYIMLDHDNGLPTELIHYYKTLKEEEIQAELPQIEAFLNKFRNSYNVLFNLLGSGGKVTSKYIYNLLKTAAFSKYYQLKHKPKLSPDIDNIELFIADNGLHNKQLGNITKYRKIRYDAFDQSQTYYFYPMHLEPEAVVLYWADGIYANQVKLIENIAGQLPPHVFLYVKDHPHLYGYRDVEDYRRIQAIPNVKLLPPNIPGKQVIKDCKGVITLNGTAGLEALLMNKDVITFGSAFYGFSNRVNFIKNIRDLREVLYNLKDKVRQDDTDLYRFVLAYLKGQKKGFIEFYGGMHLKSGVNLKENSKMVAEGMKRYFNEYNNFLKD